jgi:hypothetical protein
MNNRKIHPGQSGVISYYPVAPNCLVVARPDCLATRVCLYVSIPDFGFGLSHRLEQHWLGCIEASFISNILDS